MWHDDRNNWMQYECPKWVEDHLIKFPGGYRIKKGEIRNFFDEDFIKCAIFINRYREFGNMGLNVGHYEVPYHWVLIVELFNRAQQREYRSRGDSAGTKGNSNSRGPKSTSGPIKTRQISKPNR